MWLLAVIPKNKIFRLSCYTQLMTSTSTPGHMQPCIKMPWHAIYHATIWKSWMRCLCQSVLQIMNLLDHENKTSLFHSFDHLLENVVAVMFAQSNVLKPELNLQIPRVNRGVLHLDWSLIQNIQTEKAVYMLSSKFRILSQCGHCLYSSQDLMSCCFTFMSYLIYQTFLRYILQLLHFKNTICQTAVFFISLTGRTLFISAPRSALTFSTFFFWLTTN